MAEHPFRFQAKEAGCCACEEHSTLTGHALHIALEPVRLAKQRETAIESRDAVILGNPDSALRVGENPGHGIIREAAGGGRREDAIQRSLFIEEDQPPFRVPTAISPSWSTWTS